MRKDSRQIWADELEVDLKLERVFARGNVHIKEGQFDIFAESGTYSMKGSEGALDNATVIFGQTVIAGASLNQLGNDKFELLDGFYTNCNTVPIIDKDTSKCPFDVKIYGRKFSLTLESYVHVFDAIVYAKELPIFYTPYFVAPAKTRRQSGLLVPSLNFRQRLGNGITLPVFFALDSWHDFTFSPTWWTLIGYHLQLDYRYVYSSQKQGRAKVFLLERPFNSDTVNPWIRPNDRTHLGFFSEAAFDIHNEYSFGERSHTRLDINLVSNNYWSQDFPDDFGIFGNFQYFRNQLSVTYPTDSYLTTAAIKLNQSTINTKDSGADRGPVAQLPDIRFSRKTLSAFWDHLFFEWDNRLTNFSRPSSSFDNIPDARKTTNPDLSFQDPLKDFTFPLSSDSNSQYDSNDYIRAGQRLHMERRLFVNPTLSPGFQFQPLARAGLLGYHFELPVSTFKSQTYIDTEIPFALYLSRKYGNLSSSGSEVRHIIQPRVLYVASLFRSKTPDHPFFSNNPYPDFKSPRFDALDYNQPYEYFRFEFNNRLLKRDLGGTQRFLLAQISNNYFLKPSPLNNSEVGLGPLESYLDLQLGYFSAQVQGAYQLKKTNGVNENDLSATLAYAGANGDRVSIASLLRKRADPANNDETLVFSIYKTLPIYLDLFGSIEHSFRQALTRTYQVGFLFAAKPRNCWSLSFTSGRTVQNEYYARLVFGLTFGQI